MNSFNYSMANLLSKLRIEYSSLTMLQGITDQPKDQTIRLHSKILDGFMEGQNNEGFVSSHEYKQLQEKTYRQLRLREMLIQHSSQASLIVMSLPMPRQVRISTNFVTKVSKISKNFQGSVSAPLYMSWLDMLTMDMPPFLLVRGNQSSVLTFYS